MTSSNLPARLSKEVSAHLSKPVAERARVMLAIDATLSRDQTWDRACRLQSEMFAETAKFGLLVQLVYFRGPNEFKPSEWVSNAHALAAQMRRIRCEGGITQIGRVLEHIRQEHMRHPIGAAIFIGDAMEENIDALCAAAADLPCMFWFQEGADPAVETAFRELARITKGAYAKLDTNAARELAELLRAVAAFVGGGLTALADLRTASAKRLLTQLDGSRPSAT